MTEKNRVCCLYRVSTEKQVDHDTNNEADIPMQRKACHRFAESMGWQIVREEQEEGVSGHKVRAAARDKIQKIKEEALKGTFDILLVFMFDRIGRIADETPFVVEWLVKNGIRVWSTQEGEQRFDNHTDKLLNYIRFWQADGESEKTSIRTRTRLGQLVEEGHFKGGNAPYGYELVKSGRLNKRKHELLELKVLPEEAEVVKLIFDKYTTECYGAQRIATYLNNLGYRTRKNKKWHHASIRGMLGNLTYTGVLRSGESRSPLLPELQIITPKQFQRAEEIRKDRTTVTDGERAFPLSTTCKALLTGNVFCAHCGARLCCTTNGKYRRRADGSMDLTPRTRYVCYGKTRKQTDCDGQTGYTAHILEGIIEDLLHEIFRKLRGVPKDELIGRMYADTQNGLKIRLAEINRKRQSVQTNLDTLKAEIIKSINGESSFSSAVLSEMIEKGEREYSELDDLKEDITDQIEEGEILLTSIRERYATLVSWSEIYDNATHERRKVIINQLIKRIDVGRGYQVNVEFNFDYQQFMLGLDIKVPA